VVLLGPKEARQTPSLLRKRILGCFSIFSTGNNPQCITADTSPPSLTLRRALALTVPYVALAKSGAVFPPLKIKYRLEPPLSRYE
jgi:hypothetical protein